MHLDVSMGPDVGQDLEDPRFFLTKLTALLAFNRMPNLRTLVEGEGVKRGKQIPAITLRAGTDGEILIV